MAPLCFKRARFIIVSLLAAALLVPAAATAASAATTSIHVEVRLAALLNGERAKHGLPALRTDVRLVASARSWAKQMAKSGKLSHSSNLSGAMPAGATAWGENIASTSASNAADSIHAGLMGSPSHRALILDGRFSDLGIGVALSGGTMWAAQHFTAGAPARVSSAVEPTADLAVDLFAGGKASHAVIVRDDVFPDSLAAGPLAGGGGPILFTPPGPALHPAVRLALEQTLPRGATIWIVGGTAAVSGSVEAELAGAGWKVRRLSGADRVATAVAVAYQVAALRGHPSTVLIAAADDWPDAASGGAYGAASGAPILLAHQSELPGATAQALSKLAPKRRVALGGSAALSDSVVKKANALRLGGATRQGTSAAVAEELWGRTSAGKAPAWISTPADGEAWAWALGAAPMAARRAAPVLIAGDPLSKELSSYLAGLGYDGSASAGLTVHGPVPAGTADKLRALLR
ncbi:MAG TPA: CAP domain-containing protein [Egibacteraceae bacterium]|nr:CAP domain-containing protein [Egibacteraceae bacterium]